MPDDPSWTKRPSGKHRQVHVYDLGAFKNAIVKDGGPTVGPGVSRRSDLEKWRVRHCSGQIRALLAMP